MKKSLISLERVYFLMLFIFFFSIVAITHFIRSSINITNYVVEEEYIESLFIIILSIVAYHVFKLYRKEIIKREELILEEKKRNKSNEIQLEDAFKYIGRVNVQIQEINDIFFKLKELPEKKNELKNIVNFLTKKVLGIVNADWVVLRILDINSEKTLKESIKTRGDNASREYKISNKSLIKKEAIDGYCVIASDQKNLGLKAYFILPVNKLSKEQKILIKAIINQLEMIFIIYNSKFYKKNIE